jgi:hypothetical protein
MRTYLGHVEEGFIECDVFRGGGEREFEAVHEGVVP